METPTPALTITQAELQAELEQELRQAEEDFARGDFIELTVEEFDRCIAAGEWPWRAHPPGETVFAPGRAHVRRVPRQNIWLLYRFDDDQLFVMTARGQPPVPVEE